MPWRKLWLANTLNGKCPGLIFIKGNTLHNMKKILVAGIILTGLSCKKEAQPDSEITKPPIAVKCGVLLNTPVLDSFVFPTYYITADVAFPDGNKVVHIHDNVTGNHDGSWYLSKYDKDSTYCMNQ